MCSSPYHKKTLADIEVQSKLYTGNIKNPANITSGNILFIVDRC